MKKVNFTSCETRLVAVKVPLFEGLNYVTHLVNVPLDFYVDIAENSLENFGDYPLISLSHYYYLLRFRREFLKYVKQNSKN